MRDDSPDKPANPASKRSQFGISIVLLSILCAQYYLGFVHPLAARRFSALSKLHVYDFWPLIPYNMYAVPHFPGDVAAQTVLFGLLADGSEVPIRPNDLSLCSWHFNIFLRQILRNDVQRAEELVRLFGEQHPGKQLIGLRLESHPLIFSGTVMEHGPPQILKSVTLAPSPGRPL